MLSLKRFVCAVVGAGLTAAVMISATPASAQSLGLYGMWGEPPEKNRRPAPPPSYLGAQPALVKPSAVMQSQGGARPNISPRTPKTKAFANGFQPGTIVIDTAGRKLYYTLSSSRAYVYPIAVGKQGFTWTGVERVSKIVDWPDWVPPAEMRQRTPSLPVRMTGGVNNPLGAKAIYLGNTLYRIHGTNNARSIGSASSSGCFRMHNNHVVHLAGLVDAGTTVYVMRRLPKSGPVMPPQSRPPVTPQAQEAAAKPAEQPPQPPPAETAPRAPAQAAPAEPSADQGI